MRGEWTLQFIVSVQGLVNSRRGLDGIKIETKKEKYQKLSRV